MCVAGFPDPGGVAIKAGMSHVKLSEPTLERRRATFQTEIMLSHVEEFRVRDARVWIEAELLPLLECSMNKAKSIGARRVPIKVTIAVTRGLFLSQPFVQRAFAIRNDELPLGKINNVAPKGAGSFFEIGPEGLVC